MVKVTLNITFVRCFAWKIAGELDICISTTEYRTRGMFLLQPLSFFSSIPRNLEISNPYITPLGPWQNEGYPLSQC